LFKEIRRQGFIREKPLIYHTLKLFTEENIRIENKKVTMNEKVLEQGYNLTNLINKEVK